MFCTHLREKYNIRSKIKIVSMLLLTVVFSVRIYSADCVESFPNAVSTVNNGSISLSGNSTNIQNLSSNVLSTQSLTENSPNQSCDGSSCLASGNDAVSLTLPVNSGSDGWLNVNGGDTVVLTAGDYYYQGINLNNGGNITFSGTGTARLFINSSFNPSGNLNVGDSAANFVIFVYGDFNLNNGADLNAIVYATGNSNVSGKLNGALTSHQVTLNYGGEVIYEPNAVVTADFGSVCSGSVTLPSPISEYRLDDCKWNGVSGEVTDETGTVDGTITGSVTAGSNGKVCRGATMSGGAIDLNGLSVDTTAGAKTTVTFWMYWDETNSVMPFGWNRHDLWFINGSFGFNTGAGDLYGISSAGLENSWHHVVAVFVNGDVHSEKLYIDGVEMTLSQIRNNPSNGNAYVNSSARIGGWLASTGYHFKGMLDELKIYSGELTSAEITELFSQENSGNNPDGTTRNCSSCPIVPTCTTPQIGLFLSTYDTTGYNTYPADSTEYDSLVTTYGIFSNRFGKGIVNDINGTGNPYGADNDYLSVFEGFVDVPLDGTYLFAVDGDDAVEVFIDDILVTGWYGGHVQCNCTIHNSHIDLTAGYHKIEFHQQNRTGQNSYYLYWQKPGESDFSIVPTTVYYHCPPPSPVVEYRLDDCQWTGVVGEVKDETGTVNGTITGSVKAGANGKICRGATMSGGAIDLDSLPVDTTTGARTTVTFWMFWDGTNSVMPFGWNRHDLWFINGAFGFNTGAGDVYGINSAGLENAWHHVSAIFVNGNVHAEKLFIDGVEMSMSQLRNSPSNGNAYVNSSARIGGWLASTGYHFRGMLDELKIYTSELTGKEITEVYNSESMGNNADGSVRNCSTCPIVPTCLAPDVGLNLTTYNTTGYDTYPADHSEYDTLVTTYGTYSNRFGKGVVAEINGSGNPYGADDHYLSIFQGFIDVPTDGTYNFAVDGDDAVEVLIDGIIVTGWYGGHGRCNCTTHNGSIDLTTGYHSIEYRQQNRTGANNYYLYWQKPGDIDYSIVPTTAYYHCPPPTPVVEYRLDDCQWTGAAGEVKDETGTANGTITGAVVAGANGKICRGATMNGGAIDLDSLPVDTTTGARTSVTFWMYWDGTNSVMPFGWNRHDLWFINGAFGFNTGAGDVYGINSAGLENAWHHVSAIFVNGNVHAEKLFIDGVEMSMSQLRNSPSNGNAYVNSSARIGGWLASAGYHFRGILDELKIYSGELTSTDVLELYNKEVAGKNSDGSGRFCGLCNIADVCNSPINGLILTTYDTTGYGYYPTDHIEYLNLINNYATSSNQFGSGKVDNIDGSGNPFGDDSNYLSIFEGFINLPVDGNYSFAVDGDDAVEVLIDGVVVASWYGAHGRCNCTDHAVTIDISAGYHYIEFHHQERTGLDNYYLYWQQPGDTNFSIVPSSAFYYCPPPAPLADYRMDECKWDGTPLEVKDYTGNGHDGTAFGNSSVAVNGKVCRGGVFNLISVNDYVVLDNSVIDGAADFSVAGWFNTGKSGNQALISGANSSSSYANSWLLWQVNGTRITTYINTVTQNYALPYSIADNNWHFIVWTREGSIEKLYLDGNLVDTHTVTTDLISVNSGGLLLGQEQDSVGGGFQSGQKYEGYIDEVIFYDEALNDEDILAIYGNYNNSANFDGTTRVCLNCPVEPSCLVPDSGLQRKVYDTTGYNSYPADHLEYETLVNNYGIISNIYGTDIVATINGTGNPFGLDNYYMSVFKGYMDILADGVYEFAVDGDDAVELIIDNVVVASWYGGHGVCSCTTHSGTINLTTGYHSIEFRHQNRTGPDGYYLYWKKPGDTDFEIIPASVFYYCPPPTPLAEFRMDDCEWDGTPLEVSDSTGNGNDGTTYGNTALNLSGKLCKSGEFNLVTTDDYIILGNNSINGLSDFSYAGWYKTTNSGAQALISGANGTSAAGNGWLMYQVNGNRINTYINNVNRQYNLPYSIADNNWHFVVWTRKGTTEKLYYDGVLVGTNTVTGNPIDVSPGGLMLGQEQDNLGGGFQSSQRYIGNIDEVSFYNIELKSEDIVNLYRNYNAGYNYDETERSCLQCPVIPTCLVPDAGLSRKIYNTTGYNTYPTDHASYETLIANYAIAINLYGTDIVSTIDGSGNPFGSNDHYLSIIEGYIDVSVSGEYEFAVDGDDAVEVMIDSVVVASWYGGHGQCGCTTHNGVISLAQGYHSIEFRQQERTGGDSYHLYWKPPLASDFEIVPASVLFNCPFTPLVDYRMDACSWDGTAGEVIDSSGYDRHGTTYNSAYPNIDSILCNSGDLTENKYIRPDNTITLDDSWTLLFWAKFPLDDTSHNSALGGIKYTVGSVVGSGDLGYFVKRGNSWSWGVKDSSGATLEDSLTELTGWHHISFVRDTAETKLFIDGSLEGNVAIGTSGDFSYVGTSSDDANGQTIGAYIDEYKIFDKVLTQAEIANIMQNEQNANNWDGAVRDCAPCITVSYFEVVHDGNGTVCYPEMIMITARDVSGQVVTGFTGQVSISTSTGNGTWYANYGGLINTDPPLGTLTDATADDGFALYTFVPGDAGQITLFLRNTHFESLEINVTDGNSNSVGNNGGQLTFREKAFIITDTAGNPITNQLSGKPFDVMVKAIGQDPNTGDCDILDYSGLHNLTATLHYNTPAAGGSPINLNGVDVSAVGTPISLNFINGTVVFPAYYNDAGAINFTITDNSDSTITGSSNVFVVSPWQYYIEAVGNPKATDASGAVYVQSGENFTLNINAVCWNSADDSDNNLIPDDGADLSDNIVTMNYNPIDFTVKHTLIMPSGGVTGTLTGIPVAITNGTVSVSNAQYNEVGIIRISAISNDHISVGDGLGVTGISENIGRFYPVELRIINFTQVPACSNIFTYSDQFFNLTGSINALNIAGSVTSNYTGTFVKLVESDISVDPLTGSGSFSLGTFNLNFNNGVSAIAISGNRYGWGSPHNAEDAVLRLTGADSDGVNCTESLGVNHADSNTVNYRYGRLNIVNGYSPSDRILTLTVNAEYYKSDEPYRYILCTDDNCTTFVAADINLFNYKDSLNVGETGVSSTISVTSGVGSITLTPPGIGNEGSVDMILTNPYYMHFQSGTAYFGIYRGNDKIISWQEIEK